MLLSSRLLLLLLSTILLRGNASLLTPSFLPEVSHSSSSEKELFPCSFPFCADGRNCADIRCSGCPFNCFRTENRQCPDYSKTCEMTCKASSKRPSCSGCIHTNPKVRAQCPLGTFRDITQTIFSGEDSDYWHQWLRSGKPHWHFSSALMVDLNDDSVLDYFNSMHGTLYDEEEAGSSARIQVGHTVIDETEMERPIHFKDASWRIVVDDPREESEGYVGVIDKHGDLVADLDNDGILDIFIMSGGGSGSTITYPKSKDNLLLFGERGINHETGTEAIIFKGGRKQALDSGLEGRMARGRMSYLLDVNGDGLLDIFFVNQRRKDNSLAPGSLYINQGNRTWWEDTSMTEFVDTMILTDADGDSIAEEILVIRGYCFPERKDPDDHKAYGPFPDDIKDFCSTRPVGSTAVYKYNTMTQSMQEISPKYTNIDAANSMQPECCPHGTHNGYRNSCTAASIASGDLDGDGISDHIILYARRMEFFFSSDRPLGELPIEKKYVGLTVDLPESCTIANTIRLVDINNSGKQNIVVMCRNLATFLIYSQGARKDSWSLQKSCNDNGSLGDIDFDSSSVTNDDLMDACANRDKYMYTYINDICEEYKSGKIRNPRPQGLTLADINNDGFTDFVVGSRMGYQQFFLYQRTAKSMLNRYISFRLIGDGKDVNLYGIGATIVLFMRHEETGRIREQFREISSYQHVTDKKGHQDEKIIFGLARYWKPVKLLTRWPNGAEQTLWLTEFDYSMPIYPAIDVNYHSSIYFRIRNKKVSDSGRQLCLRRRGAKKLKIELAECAREENPQEQEHFTFNEWGMLQSRTSPDYCIIPSFIDEVARMKSCKSGRSPQNSWHETKHGFLRWSGSNKVLGVENIVAGQTSKLLNMDMANETQMWILEVVQG